MEKVFFIDDDPQVLKSFKRTLGKKNRPYEFHFYQSCEEALIDLEALGPVCCIVDKRLPGMGGEEFLRKVSEVDSLIYRILISADIPSQGSMAFCDLYLEKPVSSSSLIRAINNLREQS